MARDIYTSILVFSSKWELGVLEPSWGFLMSVYCILQSHSCPTC
uniref:Uncharacterized protein n=1 Tax=Arundo donax TaxID=35708 RepID=A0A0A9FGK6_ARUDO